MDFLEVYNEWRKFATEDSDLVNELESIKSDENEIHERFYTSLAFGTAGLRGIIGAGTNRMNIYVVRQATQGLANYVLQKFLRQTAVKFTLQGSCSPLRFFHILFVILNVRLEL